MKINVDVLFCTPIYRDDEKILGCTVTIDSDKVKNSDLDLEYAFYIAINDELYDEFNCYFDKFQLYIDKFDEIMTKISQCSS